MTCESRRAALCGVRWYDSIGGWYHILPCYPELNLWSTGYAKLEYAYWRLFVGGGDDD